MFEFCKAFARPMLKCSHPKFKKNEAFARKSKNTRAFAFSQVTKSATFRVSPGMTTSIPLRIQFSVCIFTLRDLLYHTKNHFASPFFTFFKVFQKNYGICTTTVRFPSAGMILLLRSSVQIRRLVVFIHGWHPKYSPFSTSSSTSRVTLFSLS